MRYNYSRVTEATLAAEMYRELANRGVPASLEARLPSKTHRSGWMRVDLAIGKKSDPAEVLVVIEVKLAEAGRTSPYGRQGASYEELKAAGIQVRWLRGFKNITDLADELYKLWLAT